jgi:predicted alpha/beta-fold hydrolase
LSGTVDTYTAPAWLSGAHLQTIYAARAAPLPDVAYRRERWDAPDGDFVDLDFALPAPDAAAAPVLVMFHGLEGDSSSHYSRSLMRHFADAGWRALVVHFRGCSGEPNRLARAYHSGDSEEADWVLRGVLAKWLGERGDDAAIVTAAASVGAPLDLAAGGSALARGFNRVYTRMFLASLKPKALAKAARFAGTADVVRLRASRNLYEFDNAYTAPVHGFRDTEDYWARASGKPWLGGVRVPHLVINALNDPFVPVASLPRAGDVARSVVLERPATGGHIGFARGPFPGRLDWLPQRLHAFFTRGA